jgi:hypothetical protein
MVTFFASSLAVALIDKGLIVMVYGEIALTWDEGLDVSYPQCVSYPGDDGGSSPFPARSYAIL